MSLPAEPATTPDLASSLARSRSRYRGIRSTRLFHSQQQAPQSYKEQLEPQTKSSTRREPQIDNADGQSRRPNGTKRDETHRTQAELSKSTPSGSSLQARTDSREAKSGVRDANDRSRPISKSAGGDRRLQAKASQPPTREDVESEATRPRHDYGILPPDYPQFQIDKTLDRERRLAESNRQLLQSRKVDSQPEPSRLSMLHRKKPSKSKEDIKKTISAPMPVQPPQASNKPAFDAPVSAVNAGERRVLVQHNEIKTSVSVNPSTTPVDIIRAVASQLSLPIDANANMVSESFKQLGLERPLRKYEHVRDVMNSWGDDAQNTLVIAPSIGRDDELDLKSVLRSQPGDTSVYVYHSQKPGTWDKRWVTLRSDGQMLISKKDGKEISNICHLSDFDIYRPTPKHLHKKIKPPKKVCFAVKSQQKSSMFLTTENFVHFFSTSDKELAASWYRAVQEWRSWYLVNVLGQENETSKTVQKAPDRPANPAKPPSTQASSVDEPTSPASPTQTPKAAKSPLARLPTRHHGPPPVSFPKRLTKDPYTGTSTTHDSGPSIVRGPSQQQRDEEPFNQTGLLGRTYTQRRKAMQDREGERQREQGIFIANQHTTPLDSGSTSVSNGVGGNSNSGDVQQTPTQRAPPRPLIDISGSAPPSSLQHTKSIRGNRGAAATTPQVVPPGGLVTAAVNAAPDASASFDPTSSSFLSRSQSVRRPLSTATGVGGGEDQGFTGGGLLAAYTTAAIPPPLPTTTTTTPRRQGTVRQTGGNPRAGPLLADLGLGADRRHPVIDREKRREVDISVGEGF